MKMLSPRGTTVNVMERNVDGEEISESARYVTIEEAYKDLLNAIVLQGVLDYREALWDGVYKSDSGYRIKRSQEIQECEMFFKDINFKLYKKLPDQITEFYRILDTLPEDKLLSKSKDAFKCPICQHGVEVRYIKMPSRNLMNTHSRAKKTYCPSCLMKGYIAVPISKEERSVS